MRILLALLLVAVTACGNKKKQEAAPGSGTAAAPKPTDPGPDEKPTPTEPAQPAAAPTKEAGIARLEEILAALEAKDYTKAAGYFVVPEGATPDQVEAQLGKLIAQQEISRAGITALAANAKWGKLADVLDAERAARYAEKSKVPVDECYGFSAAGNGANASVGFHWDGKELKIIRLNNVGKL